ncbi:GumC family protein [Paraglaciecola sp. 2405UD69-4]|uniref:GumC family protein n=1 Tax=Paraglaciecola sp. 2405UD69-4 TaxID=3391836 RepID=UPI0039C931BC
MKEVLVENGQEKLEMSGSVNRVDEDVIDLGEYWRTIMRAKWLIVIIALSCVLAGVLSIKKMTPMYKASVRILADPQKPTTNLEPANLTPNLVSLFYQTQYELITSRKIAESVVEKLDMVELYRNQQRSTDQKEEDKTIFDFLFSSNSDSSKDYSDEDLVIYLAKRIQQSLEVSGGRQSQIINLTYQSKDPEEAALIANAISESYIQYGLSSRQGEVQDTENWLVEQSRVLKSALQESEQKLSQYRIQEGLVDTTQQQNLVNSQLQSLNSELINAQTRLSEIEEQYFALEKAKSNPEELYSSGPVLQNGSANSLVIEQGRLLQRVNELFERYGEKHPNMIAARSELKSVTENLAIEVNKVVENIQKEYRLAQVQVSNIQKLIKGTKDDVQSAQEKNYSLISLEREVENNRRIYDNFQVSLLESNVIRNYSASNIHIIDKASIPKLPFQPNPKLILMISLSFGLLLGIALAFLREAMDNTFKTPDDVEQKLPLTVLGITPSLIKKVGAPELQYITDSLTPFAENINTIRTGLVFSNTDNPPKTILVTSANSNEGKSTLAINLATAFSHLGRTLLLEVDLRKPSIAKSFSSNKKLGLTDVLSGSSIFDEANHLIKNEGNLSVLASGGMVRNPIDLLSSNKFEEVLQDFKLHYDYIILDGPPTLPVSDSCILANKVDGVIFAVKSQYTKVKVAKEAVSRLSNLNANLIGAVLTVADSKKMRNYGEHFYSDEYYGERPTRV